MCLLAAHDSTPNEAKPGIQMCTIFFALAVSIIFVINVFVFRQNALVAQSNKSCK